MGALEKRQVADQRWRKGVDERLDDHFGRLERGDERFDVLDRKIDANTAITQRIDAGVADILHIFEALKGFTRVGGWMGRVVLYLAALVVAAGILWWFWKTGDLPRKS